MRVKVCGIKKLEDALKAVEFGADALGFLVGQKHTSSDFISKEKAKEIIDKLPPFCSSVLVTHLEDVSEIIDLAKSINVTTIQLHGDSTPEDAKFIKEQIPYIKLTKCLHVIDKDSIEKGKTYLPFVDAILLDTYNPETNQVGGTGLTHDWSISKKIIETYDKPVIVAGGLNPDNVQEAIKSLHPFGVDVNSGTKDEEGFKDYKKLKDFISNAKKA